ncbi:twin-arginine translocase TatA/TatE family subunit [Paenibacillus athensensis]|uniref:Sec-independent protein translocase protein TatA n=1 Tax=Paenibacillus athensensis TaxID=1967502 RepID=A0A4Y8Q6U1_9BACL|nr:twin-arginine translocase TatA/TatE family subunit [Paenibacillus athensensis]
MFQNIGFTEMLLIAVVALVLFGPKRLPEIGRKLGTALHQLKQGARQLMQDDARPAPAPHTAGGATPADGARPSAEATSAAAPPAPPEGAGSGVADASDDAAPVAGGEGHAAAAKPGGARRLPD